MSLTYSIEHAINKAIDFLYQNQLSYGEFKTYASPDEAMVEIEFDSTPYITTFVLYSLSFWDNSKITEMTTKGINFLLSEMEGPGLWRYWSSKHERNRFLAPDIDDTACVSYILQKNNISFPPNIDIILANKNDQGILYTYLFERPNLPNSVRASIKKLTYPESIFYLTLGGQMADNIDSSVIANVLLYIGENDNTATIINYLINLILNKHETNSSPYFPNPLTAYYLISRAYFNNTPTLALTKKSIIERVITKQYPQGNWNNETNTALATCTLLNFNYVGPEIPLGIEYLLNTQQPNGSWARFPMFIGPAPYYGSEELTTALAVEALARYLKLHS